MFPIALISLQLYADDGSIELGAQKSKNCSACHGNAGLSANPLWPNLAGQKEDYLVLQLKHFRSGERLNEIMGPLAKVLTDKDIADLSAYYSSLSPQAAEENK